MDHPNEIIRELRSHALWDALKEGARMMLPFIAGFGIREWVHVYATALMWTAAMAVAAGIAFWPWTRKMNPISTPSDDGLSSAPSILVEHSMEMDGVYERLSFRSINNRVAFKASIGKIQIRNSDWFEAIPEKFVVTAVPTVVKVRPQFSEMSTIKLLTSRPKCTYFTTVEFEDDQGRSFCQDYEIVAQKDGTIGWIRGKLKLQ
jgi:hypothetical protein